MRIDAVAISATRKPGDHVHNTLGSMKGFTARIEERRREEAAKGLPLFELPWQPPRVENAPESRKIPVADRGRMECAWTDDNVTCCGARVKSHKSSYCPAHHAIVHAPTPRLTVRVNDRSVVSRRAA